MFLDPDVHVDKYWDFSFQEMAQYDLPALFNYVLSKVNVDSVTYIGHSQGTTQLLAALCENSDFFKTRLNLAILLAPVARIDHMSASILQRLNKSELAVKAIASLGPELFPNPGGDSPILTTFISTFGVGELGYKLSADENPDLCSARARDTFLGHFPSGASFRSADHFRQLLRS
jgi:pimeloyl-ACP methyl ester carboxylesterase